jgi:hypothetical protein
MRLTVLALLHCPQLLVKDTAKHTRDQDDQFQTATDQPNDPATSSQSAQIHRSAFLIVALAPNRVLRLRS